MALILDNSRCINSKLIHISYTVWRIWRRCSDPQ